ncbi:MAG: competence/damage-inducible protein A [Armatimonadetes bacterium]|nr:competence/damage-inducible protein A [Armatimonadota bacterium]
MRAEVISIGTELLLGQITDTNAAELGQHLAKLGIDHTHRQTVGDNLARMEEALRLALGRADIVFTIGGLGPTADDLTRDAIADALDDELVTDEAVVEHLRSVYGKRGVAMVESQFRQALRPTCAEPLPNPNGTAPGLYASRSGKVVIALPGPRNEFVPMVEGPVTQKLLALGDGTQLVSRTLRVVGIGEAALAEQLADLLNGEEVTVAPYAKIGEVHLRVTTRARSDEEADSRLNPVVEIIRSRIGPALYAEGEESLEQWIVAELVKRGETLALAESCTGGLLSGRITGVDGASNALLGGIVCYSAESKVRDAGVDPIVIDQHGTVSRETAEALALGVRSRFGSSFGIGVTGVAGVVPVEEAGGIKKSGTVYIAVAGESGVRCDLFRLVGNRSTIQNRSVSYALIRLRASILGLDS